MAGDLHLQATSECASGTGSRECFISLQALAAQFISKEYLRDSNLSKVCCLGTMSLIASVCSSQYHSKLNFKFLMRLSYAVPNIL
jgi:hypothetical protein